MPTQQPLSAARGVMLGLILGDAIGAAGGAVPDTGPLPATSGGQLACCTVEGLIRADMRQRQRGFCDLPGVIRHAYTRWAAAQDIPAIRPWRHGDWPDGWLAHTAELGQHRGPAPATIAALQGTPPPAGTSRDAHAIICALPAGLWPGAPDTCARLAADIAALAHDGDAVTAAAVGAAVIRLLTAGEPIPAAAADAEQRATTGLPAVTAALTQARLAPATPEILTGLASDDLATSALAGGLYVAASFPDPADTATALLFAASAGGYAAAVAGALLGAAHGPDVLPIEWVARLELGWVADTLARDLTRQLTPLPTRGRADVTDWSTRYPAW